MLNALYVLSHGVLTKIVGHLTNKETDLELRSDQPIGIKAKFQTPFL